MTRVTFENGRRRDPNPPATVSLLTKPLPPRISATTIRMVPRSTRVTQRTASIRDLTKRSRAAAREWSDSDVGAARKPGRRQEEAGGGLDASGPRSLNECGWATERETAADNRA